VTTFRLGVATHKIQYKKKAGRGIREIKKFASKTMGTKVVKVLPEVNQHVWKNGIRRLPRRIRLKLSRRAHDGGDEEDDPFFTEVSLVDVDSFKDLQTEVDISAEGEE